MVQKIIFSLFLIVINSTVFSFNIIICGKVLDYELDGQDLVPDVGEMQIFFTPSYPDWSWGPLSLLQSDYRVLSPGVKVAESRINHPTSS